MPRPSTPGTRAPRPAGPSSPPQTPTSTSPVGLRKGGPNGTARPKFDLPRAMPPRPNGRLPENGGHLRFRPDQLSPRSSDDDDESSDESDDGDSSGTDSPPRSLSPDLSDGPPPAPPAPPVSRVAARRVITETTWIIEELSDFDSEDGRHPVLRPHAIEYADSDRSRSRSRNPPEVDRAMLSSLRDLSCGSESDEADLDEAEYDHFRLRQRETRRLRRLNSGSIGKRTISESIGSGSDREDIRAALLDAAEVGSSARRLRRRVGDRRSLNFQDPPPSRIDELEEPDSSDDDMVEVGEALAKELPYYTLEYISMEVDSS